MVTPPRTTGLRRLKLEELISKLAQIEEQVSRTLDEYPHGHTLERQRLVLAIAKQVRSHLTDQLRAGQRVAIIPDESEARHLRVVEAEKRNASTQS
jgi:molybdopterin converting factor small subunit